MRLVDLDQYEASNETGKTAVLKALTKYEKEHPLKELILPNSEYDITFYPKETKVVMRRKETRAEEN